MAVHHGPRTLYRSNQTESIESKFAKIFKRPKNRSDGSDFADFWTESIVSTQSIFSKSFERTKIYRINRIDRFDRAIGRSIGSIDGRRVYGVHNSSLRPSVTVHRKFVRASEMLPSNRPSVRLSVHPSFRRHCPRIYAYDFQLAL